MPEDPRAQPGAEQFICENPPAGTYIGFDYGLKRIGVASGNSVSCTAMPLETISNRNGTPDWARIDAIVEQWQPVALIVGNPLQMDGSVQAITHHASGFGRRLAQRYALPVLPADERLSSMQAAAIVKKNRQLQARRRASAADIDKIAASEILQRWLQTHFA